MNDSNEWALPKKLFEGICNDTNLSPLLDVAATENNTKCEKFFTKEDNALEQEWLVSGEKVTVYCNPPMAHKAGEPTGKKMFFKKAFQQWKKHNITILFILTSDAYTTSYFWKYALRYNKKYGESCVSIKTFKSRPALEKADGTNDNKSPKGFFAVVFREWKGELDHDSDKPTEALRCVGN